MGGPVWGLGQDSIGDTQQTGPEFNRRDEFLLVV